MVILGAHVSAAAGLRRSLEEAARLQVQALQLCTRSASRWFTPPLEPDEVIGFRQRAARIDRNHLFALASPLINLAAPDEAVYKRSLDALYDEVMRAEALGMAWVVVSCGQHAGQGEEWGQRQLIGALNKTLDRTRHFKCGLLLETSAGGEHELGGRFDQIARVRRKLDDAKRVGVCLDTSKMFAAGYDMRDAATYNATMAELDRALGIKYIRLVHLSDSLFPLGSRKAGPTHIGEGEMGADAFALLLNDLRFEEVPLILETPRNLEADHDKRNLQRLASLVGKVTAT